MRKFITVVFISIALTSSAQNWTHVIYNCYEVNVLKNNPQNNIMYLGGTFCDINSIGNTKGVAKYDGVSFTPVDNGITDSYFTTFVNDLEFYGGALFMCGFFDSAGYSPVYNISKLVSNQWTSVGGGANDTVADMCVHNGELYVVGRFSQIGNVTTTGLAKWNGFFWQSILNWSNVKAIR